MTLDPRTEPSLDVDSASSVDGLLDVWLGDERVATLNPAAGAGTASLTYTPEALDRHVEGTPLLSVRLPVVAAAYPGEHVRPFLAGLLPEERVKEELARRAGVAPDDLVGLLRAYGGECAGAVAVLESGTRPGTSDDEVHWLDDDALDKAIRHLPVAPFGVDVDPKVRTSLGGVQGKLIVVRRDDGAFGIPLGTNASTHILKPAPLNADGSERFPALAWLEALGLAVTAGGGIATAHAEVLRSDVRPAMLLVTRFDRSVDQQTARVTRIHQEDLTQAIGVLPSDKYQTSAGRVSWKKAARVLADFSAQPLIQQLSLVDRMVASVAVGDADAHAKNLSFHLRDGFADLAPAYDVIPTLTYANANSDVSLHVNRQSELRDVTFDDVVAEAQTWGLGGRAVRSRARDVLEGMNHAVVVETERLVVQAEGDDEGVRLLKAAGEGIAGRVQVMLRSA